jgi:[protein-PII] uridylyltransferase
VQRRLRRASWAASAVPQVATKLRIDDVSSAECTILDVFTQDKPGLLHAIAEALHRARVSIVVARIATEGNRATDAFYLREASGQAGQLGSEERKREVENAVRMAIEELAGRS